MDEWETEGKAAGADGRREGAVEEGPATMPGIEPSMRTVRCSTAAAGSFPAKSSCARLS